MNRRDFLARLGLAAGAVALSPLLDLAEILPAPSTTSFAPVTFHGIPLVFDDMLPRPTIIVCSRQMFETYNRLIGAASPHPFVRALAHRNSRTQGL